MKIIEVISKKQINDWHNIPNSIYINNPYWIKPLIQDQEKPFIKEKNPFYKHGNAKRWLLLSYDGNYIGRIAAFWSQKGGKRKKMPGCGFFECINDQEAANTLFEKAKQWLQNEGATYMDGMINFGERDRFWGVLVYGFDKSPNYCCNYNPDYYPSLMENYGFKTYFEQFTFGRQVGLELVDKMEEKASRVFKNPKYRFNHINKNNLDNVAKDFTEVYNEAWEAIGTPKIKQSEAKAILYSIKPIIDERIIWFGFYEDNPVAMFACIPDVNEYIKSYNGKLHLWNKLKLGFNLKFRRKANKCVGIIIGVHTQHQRKGVESAIIVSFRNFLKNRGLLYKSLEMNWIGDFNPKMMKVAQNIDAKVLKKHITYRYLFDRSLHFKRKAIVG